MLLNAWYIRNKNSITKKSVKAGLLKPMKSVLNIIINRSVFPNEEAILKKELNT